MTGPEHYQEAERLLAMCVDSDGNPPARPAPELDAYVGLAGVHAALALAAATALNGAAVGMPDDDYDVWHDVAATTTEWRADAETLDAETRSSP